MVLYKNYFSSAGDIAGPDIARGEGLEESSSDDDDIEEDEASNQAAGMKQF